MSIYSRVKEILTLPLWEKKTIEVNNILKGDSYEYSDASYSKNSYTELAKDGYENCATVYRCINLIVKNFAPIPSGIYQETEEGQEFLPTHPKTVMLKKPNSLLCRTAFFENLALYMLCGGHAFIRAIPDKFDPERILSLDLLPVQEVIINESNSFMEIDSYTWTHNNIPKRLSKEEVLYLWFPNPRDPMKPMSPLKAIAREIDINAEALKFNLQLLTNGGRSPYWISPENSEVSIDEPQKQAILKAHKNLQIGEPLVFKEAMTLSEFGASPVDLALINSLDKADERISFAFNVPSELVGGKSVYKNMKEANKALFTQAVIPLGDYIMDSLTGWKMLRLQDNEIFGMRKENVDALRPDQDALSTRLQGEVDRGIINRNEARTQKGMERDTKNPMMDEYTIAGSVMPLGQISIEDGTEDLSLQEADNDKNNFPLKADEKDIEDDIEDDKE